MIDKGYDIKEYFPGFYGREKELDLFSSMLDATSQKGFQGLMLSGAPGIGKSRLLYEFNEHTRNSGCSSVLYHFREGLQIPSMTVWKRLLERLIDNGLPDLSSHTLFDSLFSLLKHISRDHTVCLYLDNIHFAPDPFFNELLEAVDELSRESVIFVAAYQDIPLYRKDPFLHFLSDITSIPHFEEYRLGPLSNQVSRFMIEDIAGTPIYADLSELVTGWGMGNPLFLQEIARLLRGQQELRSTTTDSFWTSDVPQVVYKVISRRLHHLSSSSLSFIRKVSLLGGHFSYDDLLLLNDGQELCSGDRCLDEAISHGFIVTENEEKKYGFSHSLIHTAIRYTIPIEEKKRICLELARRVEETGAGTDPKWAALISEWWLLYGQTEEERVVKSRGYALVAARYTMAQKDFSRARSILERVFPMRTASLETKQDADILFTLGEINNLDARYSEAMEYFRKAIRYYLEHGEKENILRLSLHPVHAPIGDPDMSDLYTDILSDPRCAGAYRGMTLMHYAGTLINNRGDYCSAEKVIQEAYEISIQERDDRLMMVSFVVISYLHYHFGRFDEASIKLLDAERLQARVGDMYSWPNIYLGRSANSIASGSHRKAVGLIGQMIECTERIPESSSLFMSYVVAARLMMLDGLWDEATAYIERGLSKYPENSFLLGHRIYIAYVLGQIDTGDHFKRYLNSLQNRLNSTASMLTLHASGVEVVRALCTGHIDCLGKTKNRLYSLVSRAKQHPFISIRAHTLLCLIASMLDDAELASECSHKLKNNTRYYLIRHYYVYRALSLAAHCRAHHEEAFEYMDRALESVRFYHDRPMEAVLLYEASNMYVCEEAGEGLLRQAQEMLSDARLRAYELGMTPLVRRTEQALSRILNANGEGDTQHIHLTLREKEILRLAGEGATNSSIALQLHLSTHTVSNHVKNILKKTGSQNRTAAYAIARKKGLV